MGFPLLLLSSALGGAPAAVIADSGPATVTATSGPAPPRVVAGVCAWRDETCTASPDVIDELARGALARARARVTVCLSRTAPDGEGECVFGVGTGTGSHARACSTVEIEPGVSLCLPRNANPRAAAGAFGPGVAGLVEASRRLDACEVSAAWTGPRRRACLRDWTSFLRFVGLGGATFKLARVTAACDLATDPSACEATTVSVLVRRRPD